MDQALAAVETDRSDAFRSIASPVAPMSASAIDPDDFSALVAAVYDTTLEPERWTGVLPACRDFVGGFSASIISKDITGHGQIYQVDNRIDPHYVQLYFERYVRMDPSNVAHLFADIDQPISTADVHDLDEFRETRFYREWGAPQGLVDFMVAPIEKAGGWAAMFGVFRHERDGMVDDAARDRMRLIVPHIRRAVLIGKVVEQGRQHAASLGETLDGLAAGTFLVDATGRVVHANAAGSAMLGGRGVIDQRSGRIVTVDRAAEAALTEALSAAAAGDETIGVKGISVSLQSRDGENYVAHVLPLTSGTRRKTGTTYNAVAALFIQRATFAAPSAPEVVAKTFGLTASELRVLVTVVQIGGVAETAESLGIADATVKTHLHRVFNKTGTNRQSDLVKLFAAYSSPLSR